MRWAGHVALMGDMRNAYKILVEKYMKDNLGRPRLRWENYIKIGWGGVCVDWIQLARDRVLWRSFVNMIMNHWVP
jgi:hypothetical protein